MTRRLFPKTLALVALAATLSAAPPARAQGQEPPAIVLTAKSVNELLADFRYFVAAVAPADDPQVGQVLAVLDSLKDPAALRGVDPSKPLGAYGSMPQAGGLPSAVVFIPVVDVDMFLGALGGAGLTVEPDNAAPGFTHKLTIPNLPMPLFVTSGGGYLYVSLAADGADALKKMNPATLLPRRPGAGDLSLTLRLDRLGPGFADQFNAGLEQSLAAQRDRKPGEGDAEYQARTAFTKLFADAFVALVRDGRELSLDLVIDPKSEFAGLELNSSAKPGTPYAAALRKLGAMKSKFRGVTAGAALGGSAAVPIGPALRDLLNQGLDAGKAQAMADPKVAENPVAQKVLAQVIDAARATVASEALDAAFAVQGAAPGAAANYTGVMAMAIRGGKKIESALRDAAKAMSAEERKGLTLDAAKAADGTAIHKVVNAKADAKSIATFGDNTAYVAFRDDVAAFALGKGGQAAINGVLAAGKMAMPASGAGMTAAAPQVEFFVAASKIAGLADTPAARDAQTAAAAEVFAGPAAKKDRISMVLRAQGDAMTLRLGSDVPALKFVARLGINEQVKVKQ